MSDSAKPTSGLFPFMPFPIPGLATPASAPTMSGGADLLKTLWGNLPGSSQVPGFLVPTLDVEELDKRITDLRAAESWVEVNLNMLRATIQGLEVQRSTIAALQAMSVTTSAVAPATVSESDATPSTPGLAAGSWLSYMQDQFTKVAEAALAAGGAAATASGASATGRKVAKTRVGKGRVAKS